MPDPVRSRQVRRAQEKKRLMAEYAEIEQKYKDDKKKKDKAISAWLKKNAWKLSDKDIFAEDKVKSDLKSSRIKIQENPVEDRVKRARRAKRGRKIAA